MLAAPLLRCTERAVHRAGRGDRHGHLLGELLDGRGGRLEGVPAGYARRQLPAGAHNLRTAMYWACPADTVRLSIFSSVVACVVAFVGR